MYIYTNPTGTALPSASKWQLCLGNREHGDLAVDLGARCIERHLYIYIYVLYKHMVLSQRKHKCTIFYPEVGALSTTNGNDWQSDVTQKHGKQKQKQKLCGNLSNSK